MADDEWTTPLSADDEDRQHITNAGGWCRVVYPDSRSDHDDETMLFQHGVESAIVFEVVAPKGSRFRVTRPTMDAPVRVVVTQGDANPAAPDRVVAVDFMGTFRR